MVNKMLKINNYIHKNIIFLISLLLMLQPIIDTLIGLSIEYNYLTSFTFIFRFSIFAFFLYYFIFYISINTLKILFAIIRR